MGAKNNDSTSEKQAIVKIYTMEYRKCGNFNSKNDSRPCMGASAFLKSVDFTAFEINVKTIAPTQKLYQSGHAIWWYVAPTIINSFLEQYDFHDKTIITLATSGGSGMGNTSHTLVSSCQGAILKEGKVFSANTDTNNLIEWAASILS